MSVDSTGAAVHGQSLASGCAACCTAASCLPRSILLLLIQPPPLSFPPCSLAETAGEKLLVWSALTAIALQLAGAYVALSLTLRLPTSSKSQ